MSSFPPPPRRPEDEPSEGRPPDGPAHEGQDDGAHRVSGEGLGPAQGYGAPAGYPGEGGYRAGQYTEPGYSGQPAYQQGQPAYSPGQPAYQQGQPGQHGYQQGYQQGYGQPRNGLGIAALVVGIISLLVAWIPFIGLAGALGGIIAIILGVMGLGRVRRGEATNRGMNIAGIVLGAIALILGIVTTVAGASFVARFFDEDVQACVEQYTGDQGALEQCIEDAARN